jgi:hypothetical protein
VPVDHPPGACQRARTNQRSRRADGAQTSGPCVDDPLTQRNCSKPLLAGVNREKRRVIAFSAACVKAAAAATCFGHTERRAKPRTGNFEVPQDVSSLRKNGVRQFIDRLAEAHGVPLNPGGWDEFADNLTRLAGDEPMPDTTGRLLVELKRRDIINDQQLARLVTNYMAEDAHVRSVP